MHYKVDASTFATISYSEPANQKSKDKQRINNLSSQLNKNNSQDTI